ncbi:MAG: Fe-S protein assembly co-chaperone HscB [Myxococcota bacterium]
MNPSPSNGASEAGASTKTNPFAVLGLAPAFDIDPQELEERYRALQKALHPDRFAQASASERRLSLERAVTVNEAYRRMKDDVARAEALLELRGVAVGETGGQPTDPEFLMEVMELREELADARKSKDLDQVGKLGGIIEDRRRALIQTIGAEFRREADAREILTALSRIRYYHRFLEEVEVIEDEALG